MSTTKLAKLVRRLIVKTQEGKVDWADTEVEGLYQVVFPQYAIRIRREMVDEPDMYHTVVSILNARGELIEEAYDAEIAENEGVTYKSMRDLYTAARRQAMDVDKALDTLLASLEDPPFSLDDLRDILAGHPPRTERDIQDALESLLQSAHLRFRREAKVEYAGKRFIADFASEDMAIAIEVKFLKTASRRAMMVDELLADLAAFEPNFKRVYFVVYNSTKVPKSFFGRISRELPPGIELLEIRP